MTDDSSSAEQKPYHSPSERKAQGKSLRAKAPRSSHADWAPAGDRPDPVDLLTGQDADRLQDLVPIRHSRMAASPFTFYRGGAMIMAADLADTPVTGLNAQICGDAHLSNFGSFASPEREQVFDINDFDETRSGPWEWDLKRLATSVVLAGRDNDFGEDETREHVQASVAAYRQAMGGLVDRGTMDIWYAHASLDRITAAMPSKKDRTQISKTAAKYRSKDSLKAASKLTEQVDGKTRIKAQPPLLVPLRNVDVDADTLQNDIRQSLERYRDSVSSEIKVLLGRFRLIDIALKVVGVGSVGTRCFIALLEGSDAGDPLMLQVKEASDSALEDYLPPSKHAHHGQRVVEGQRLMQSTPDIFLGWSEIDSGKQYYWRQFHDMKGSADVAAMNSRRMGMYVSLCGTTLAHTHARSGDPVAISAYLGKGDVFDRAVTEFAFKYAAQNQSDYEEFKEAIASGRIEAEDG